MKNLSACLSSRDTSKGLDHVAGCSREGGWNIITPSFTKHQFLDGADPTAAPTHSPQPTPCVVLQVLKGFSSDVLETFSAVLLKKPMQAMHVICVFLDKDHPLVVVMCVGAG